MFYRWLASARKARHRRLLLQEREEQMKLTVVAAAWSKWRERYRDMRLQPMASFLVIHSQIVTILMYVVKADNFLLQGQKNLVFRAFGIWHSKSRVSPSGGCH